MSLQSWQETLTAAIADGPTITAAAPTVAIPSAAIITLPNNFFYPGRMIKISAQGRISCAVTTPGTARWGIFFNNVVNCDSLALNLNVVAKVNVPWWLEILGTCRTSGNGTSATIFWFGQFSSEAVVGSALPTAGGNGTLTFTHGGVGATAIGAGFDSTAAIPIDLRYTQTVATGSLTLQEYKIESLT